MNKEEIILLNKAMGERISELRKAGSLEVKTLADRVGLGKFALEKIEAGAVHITYDTWIGICLGLGVHPKAFMDFDYLGGAKGVLDKMAGQPTKEGLIRFFASLEIKGSISQAVREELGTALEMVPLTKKKAGDSREESGDAFYFAVDGAMLITQVGQGIPVGFLTAGNVFFDLVRFAAGGRNRFLLRPLKDMVVYRIAGKEMLGLMERHKTFRVLLKLIWAQTEQMMEERNNLLTLPRKERIPAMYKQYPEWAREVPSVALPLFLDMGRSFFLLNKKYRRDKEAGEGSV